MPRTKQMSKSKQNRESLEESDLFLKDFQKQVQLQLTKIEAEAKMSIESYITYHDVKISGIPAKLKQMTLGEIMAWNDDQKENNEATFSINDQTWTCAPATVKAKKTSKRTTTVSDDGYVTESTAVRSTRPSQTSRTSRAKKTTSNAQTQRATRSSSRHRALTSNEMIYKTSSKNKTNEAQSTAEKFKTPATLKPLQNQYNVITPKIRPNTPVNVLRRPREGEMVLSMQGSPLLTSAIVQDKTANINVPLSNGNMISLLPNDGLRMSHIPALDSETIRQLETLKSHIEKVISYK